MVPKKSMKGKCTTINNLSIYEGTIQGGEAKCKMSWRKKNWIARAFIMETINNNNTIGAQLG